MGGSKNDQHKLLRQNLKQARVRDIMAEFFPNIDLRSLATGSKKGL